MPSTPRFTAARAAALATLLACPASANAQQLSGQASAQVTIRVQPTLVIRSLVPAMARMESSDKLAAAVVVNIESSIPYRLAVRLAVPAADARVRVLVRNAAGAFEPLLPGASVVAVVSQTPGERGHEIVCRLEAAAPELLDSARCELAYELSAEYHDRLLRATATVQTLPRR